MNNAPVHVLQGNSKQGSQRRREIHHMIASRGALGFVAVRFQLLPTMMTLTSRIHGRVEEGPDRLAAQMQPTLLETWSYLRRICHSASQTRVRISPI